MRKDEYKIQADFVKQIRLCHPTLLMTISPAGMILSPGMAQKTIKMGYKKGTPDILVFEVRGPYHGLFIEFKTPQDKISTEQILFLSALRARGYSTAVCRSTEQAVEVVETYLKLPSQLREISI